MAINSKQQIGLLFGVDNTGLDKGSGGTIAGQLQTISNAINREGKYTQIKFSVDIPATTDQIQKQLNQIAKGLTIKIGGFDQSTIQQNAKKQADALARQVDNASNKLAGMGREDDILKYGNVAGVAKQFQTYTKAVNEAKAAEAAMNANRNPQTQQAFIDKFRIAANEQKKLEAAFKNSTALDKQSLAYNKVIARITEYQAKNKETLKNTPELAAKLEELNQQLSKGTFKGTKTDAQNRFVSLTNQIRAAGGEAETLWQKVKRIFGQKFGYGIMATAAMMARRAFRQIYQEVVEIDSALTQLSIVSGKSTATLREGLDSVANSARDANTSIKDMLKSMETYARLGYNLDDSEYMSKITNMYANVANTDTETATSSLTAILKGYKYEAEDLESIADILVKVGQEYAISAEELGTGLQTAGATLAVTGTDLQKSVALLTAGNAAMQDADKVATALKTSALRLQGTEASKSELEEMGEDITDLAEGTSKLRAEIKALSGVDIMISDTQYKDMYTTYVELAKVWDKLTQTQRNTILEDLGGKRNSSVIASIILNLKDLEDSYNSASNASGTLAKANDVYSQSIQGHMNDLKTTFTEVSNNLLDSGLVKGIVDIGDGLLKLINLLEKIKFLLPIIVAGFMSWKNVGKLNSQNMPAYAQLQLVA